MSLQKTDVLIVGAGPTGLMAACQLALRKINFTIIDKTADHTRQSRAIIIHARTLEVFEHMGVVDEFLKQGQKANAFNFLLKGLKQFKIEVSKIKEKSTLFPYFLILEQAKTEAILLKFLKKLGHQVERNNELLHLKQGKNLVTATLQKASKKYTLLAKYLIGADGASSKVRHLLKIPFQGTTYQKSFFVLDCKTDWEGPTDELWGSFGPHDFGLFLPMKEKQKIRVIGVLPQGLENQNQIKFEEVYPKFMKSLGLDIKLKNPQWISVYRTHHRCVENFQLGRCFLAGDAAHIHSPVGGQGMNTGLQDAYNLAWKIAMVLQNQAQEKILETYNLERINFARQLVRTTDRIFSYVISENPLIRFFRVHLFPKIASSLLKIDRNKLKFFNRMSQLAIAYPSSPLSEKLKNSPSFGLQPGDRFPHLMINKMPLEVYLKGTEFHLFAWKKNKETDALITTLEKKWGKFVRCHAIKSAALEKLLNMKSGICLIRPDRYIAFIDDDLTGKSLEDYLEKYFIPNFS